MKKLTICIAALISIALLAVGCAAPDGLVLSKATGYGINIQAWDAGTQSPVLKIGLVRDEYLRASSNVVQNSQFISRTDYESEGWFKGNRVGTVISFGADAVKQPSSGQQMPSLGGANTVWQPAQQAK